MKPDSKTNNIALLHRSKPPVFLKPSAFNSVISAASILQEIQIRRRQA